VLLVLLLNVSPDATDVDNRFRFSPASIRLCVNGQNYFPEGSIETSGGSPRLYVKKSDDLLLMAAGAPGIDVACLVDRSTVLDGDPKAKEAKVKKGAFLEIKRMARIDLSGKDVEGAPPTSDKYSVARKAGLEVPKPGAKTKPGAGGAPAAPIPFAAESAQVLSQLFTPVNTGSYQGDPANITMASGSAVIRQRKFAKLEMNTTQSIALFSKGDFQLAELFVPEGKKMVQVKGAPSGNDPWAWAERLGSFELIDSAGVKYKPQGGWAKVKQGTADKMVARYNADASVSDITKEQGTPLDVWIVFLVPPGKQITDLQFSGQSVGTVNLQVP